MGKSEASQVSAFQLEGRFLRFVMEDGYKIKRLWLATADGECCVKLSKESRASIGRVLVPGDWIRISGRQKVDWKTGEVKLKADLIVPVAPRSLEAVPVKAATPAKKANILMCQKSDCMKRGGRGVCRALEMELSDRGLADEVTIKGTGCMKQCKGGPNIVMPDKTRYSRIRPEEVPAVLDKHFPTETASKSDSTHSVPVPALTE